MEVTFQSYLAKIQPTLNFKSAQTVIELAAEGATVPFMARYRKEKTGNMDEVQIRAVLETHETYNEIIKRKVFLVKEIGEQGNLTEEIKKRIEMSFDLGELEEIYRPFKKKKKTKATLAREAGLEPLAQWIWDLGHGVIADATTLEVKAKDFISQAHNIATYDIALKGAQDIIVERLANLPELRAKVIQDYMANGKVISKKAKKYKENSKFEMYAEFEDRVKSLLDAKASHRYLAMRRGWQEEELTLEIKGSDEKHLDEYVRAATSLPTTPAGEYLATSAKLALQVYVLPSVVNEVHRELKDKADQDAIKVFAENVKRVLLASPYGPHMVLAVDPGLRTGCKVVLVDKAGAFISNTVVHIHGDKAFENAKKLFSEVLKNIKIEAIAVGNGTAGREAETFFRKLVKELGQNIPVIMVNESGASVYSASDVARQEFPELDVTIRGAISIARRLQDPLSELVKIDPKSIGVGQYQHDVNQTALKKGLDHVVESCVNAVGVDLNTASAPLLSYVSGIGPGLAQNIVEFRKTKGLFADRYDLMNVAKFSTKTFEQAAGFLRIRGGKVSLDSTGVHPERYTAVRDMATELGVQVTDLMGEGAKKLLPLKPKWASIIGDFTFEDIVKELEKPGRDPRDPFKVFQFRDDISEVKDLKEGMICPGIVTNVTNFGAFVDVGVHQDGLVHISELAWSFVEDPRKVVNPGDQVTVRVLGVDLAKNQISFSMKLEPAPERAAKPERRPAAPQADQAQQRQQPKYGEKRPQQQQQGQHQGRPQGGGDKRGYQQGSQHGNRSAPSKPQKTPFNNPFAGLQTMLKK